MIAGRGPPLFQTKIANCCCWDSSARDQGPNNAAHLGAWLNTVFSTAVKQIYAVRVSGNPTST